MRQVEKCLGSGRIARRLGQLPEGPSFLTQWQGLASRITALTKQRNAAVHSAVAWSAGGLGRTTGGTLDGQTSQLDPAHDQKLANDLGILGTDLGLFTTLLGFKLPFAGDGKVITLWIASARDEKTPAIADRDFVRLGPGRKFRPYDPQSRGIAISKFGVG